MEIGQTEGFKQVPALSAIVHVDSDLSPDTFIEKPSGSYIYEDSVIKPEMLTTRSEPNEILMGNEFYQIDVEIEIASTSANFERGNIYLQAQFNSLMRNVANKTIVR